VVICLGRVADLHMVQLMLLLASVKSRLVLVPSHPGNPGQSPEDLKSRARARALVCVCVCSRSFQFLL